MMIENLTKSNRMVVLSALAEVQRRDPEYYTNHPEVVVSSSEVSALMTLIERDFGSDLFKPSDFITGGGHAGLCHDPVDDVPLDELCEAIIGIVENRERVS